MLNNSLRKRTVLSIVEPTSLIAIYTLVHSSGCYNRVMARVLLLGYFGAGNFGDDALLAAWLLTHQRFLQQHNLVVDATTGGRQPLEGFLEGAGLVKFTGRFIPKREALSMPLDDYTAVLAPGGSLLQDKTSLRSLLYYLEVIRRFSLSRKRAFLLNQGIGPIKSRFGRIATPYVLRKAAMLSFRDRDSYSWAQQQLSLHGHRELHLSADPLLAPVFEYSPEIEGSADYRSGYVLFIPKASTPLGTAEAAREAAQVAQLVATTVKASGLRPVLLPLHAEQDEPFCHAVAAALTMPVELYGAAAKPRFRNNAVFTLIAKASIVVSHRLHGLVCAAAYGVPAVGIAYDPKISAFCEEIGIPMISLSKLDNPQSIELLIQTWNSRDRLIERILQRREQMLLRRASAQEKFFALWQ